MRLFLTLVKWETYKRVFQVLKGSIIYDKTFKYYFFNDLSHSNLSTSKFENRMLRLKLVNHDIGNPTFFEN